MKLIIADINNDPSQTAAKNTTNFIHNARFVYFVYTERFIIIIIIIIMIFMQGI
jgi:hypothetical protein